MILSTEDPEFIATANRYAVEFMTTARTWAGLAWTIRPGVKCHVRKGVRGVPPGFYTVERHYRLTGEHGLVVRVQVAAAALKVTPKTPRFTVAPADVEVVPDFAFPFSFTGWTAAEKHLHLSGVIGKTGGAIQWPIVADALADYYDDLRADSIASAGRTGSDHFEPLARLLSGETVPFIARIIRNAVDNPALSAPPTIHPAAKTWNYAGPIDPHKSLKELYETEAKPVSG